MNSIVIFIFLFATGLSLGGFFFVGLWWTVRKGLASKNPAFWFLSSALLRTGAVMAAFYFSSQGDWRRLVVCLLGFFAARMVVTRRTGINKELSHAP